MTAKRYSPFADGAPDGWPDEYVAASDYDALAAKLSAIERVHAEWFAGKIGDTDFVDVLDDLIRDRPPDKGNAP